MNPYDVKLNGDDISGTDFSYMNTMSLSQLKLNSFDKPENLILIQKIIWNDKVWDFYDSNRLRLAHIEVLKYVGNALCVFY